MACSSYIESDLGRTKIVTSASRPTGALRYTGQRIFESDTGRELMYDGAGWVIMSEPAQTWNPTFASGVTVGNGTWGAGSYNRSDGFVTLSRAVFTLGSTSAVTAAIVFNLPVAAAAAVESPDIGAIAAISGAFYPLHIGGGSASQAVLYGLNAGGSYLAITSTSSTIPGSWTTGSTLTIQRGRYRMATRYS